MATTADHMVARGDADLFARFIARAEMLGVDNASSWVQANIGKLVGQVVEQGQTITDVYAYASNVRREYVEATPQRPGENMGAVTDVHLQTAIQAILPEPEPNE